jgi:creatinine amidohydrolase
MSQPQVLIAEMTWEEIEQAADPETVVVLPVGATEQHGPHLAVKTDTALVEAIALRAALAASDRARVLVAPALPYGYSGYHSGFPGSPSISQLTYIRLVTELGQSLLQGGFRRLLILNGHGGNTPALEVAVEELYATTGATIALTSYWTLAATEIAALRESEPGGICHACELETSCLLALDPAAVRSERLEKAIPRGPGGGILCDLVAESDLGPVFHARDASPSGVLGDPTLASAEKGRRFLEAIVGRVAALLVDMVHWDPGPVQ